MKTHTHYTHSRVAFANLEEVVTRWSDDDAIYGTDTPILGGCTPHSIINMQGIFGKEGEFTNPSV